MGRMHWSGRFCGGDLGPRRREFESRHRLLPWCTRFPHLFVANLKIRLAGDGPVNITTITHLERQILFCNLALRNLLPLIC